MTPPDELRPSWAELIASLQGLPDMPFTPDAPDPPGTRPRARHVKPFVYESLSTKALHFSICEIQSRMQIEHPDALDLEYTRTMMGFLLFVPDPRVIAMIGLGGGSLAKFCFRYLPRARIRVVEINPHVIALRDEFRVPPDGARFSVERGCGARFVRRTQARPDVLMVDGFDAQGQPDQLGTQGFYDACADRLADGGMLVVNLHSGHASYDTLLQRIRHSFDGAVLAVGDTDISNSIVFAWKGGRFDGVAAHTRRRPRRLAPAASAQVADAFSRVEAALASAGASGRA
jgi:spermidine synthase